jgi:hypothetical protein
MKSELIIDKYGVKRWYLNSELHREDGPACEYSDGSKEWWLNDLRHREDGPAIDNGDDYKWWYINGKQYTEPEHKHEIRSIKLLKLLK